MNILKKQSFLVGLAIVARLIPHPWNFTPLGGFALFAGAKYSPRTVWMVPVAVLLVTDAIIGFYDWQVMAGVYLGFVAAPYIGRLLLSKTWKGGRWLLASGVAAIVFFLISNFAVWGAGHYPQNLSGLLAAYIAGLPFLAVSFLGDATYTFVLFKADELVEQHRLSGDTA